MGDSILQFKNVTKRFADNETVAVDDISFSVAKGELFVLVGASGSGKTTTLRMINRLVEPSEGEILFRGNAIKNADIRDLRFQMGYVLQSIALFPNMTVEENIAVIPELKKMPKNQIQKIVTDSLRSVGLDPSEYRHRMPTELSGGEQQRIGILRAFASDPAIILMDEPFSALDPISRNQLQSLVAELHEKTKTTIIFVTHDMDEALKLGDRIAVMRQGKIEQIGTGNEILTHPANDFVHQMFAKILTNDVYGVYLNRLDYLGFLTDETVTDESLPEVGIDDTISDVFKLLGQTDSVAVKMNNGTKKILTEKVLLQFMKDFNEKMR
ncbi:ABC transporter ATP-binding protein [Lentilactobacillus sp. Marseille-Q4993]|uniref:ABC transporter ATP-binding protein n=1 Tax=Lentilactobacillus sp. Marseille-Q4993 TaxID=3039492 RepID=UPI0024BCA607|nr:ABC transporter ATP-binding protein [Lentilactobacillus sp. Marseille-Q4993]